MLAAVARRAFGTSGRGYFFREVPAKTPKPYDRFVADEALDRDNRPHVRMHIAPAHTPTEPIGSIIVELATDVVPQTAGRFLDLCTREFPKGYANSMISRAVKGMFVEAGHLMRKPTGGHLLWDMRTHPNDKPPSFDIVKKGLAPEFFDRMPHEDFVLRHSEPGVVTMLNVGPDAVTTLFSVTLDQMPHLDGRQVAVGKVVAGLGTLEALCKGELVGKGILKETHMFTTVEQMSEAEVVAWRQEAAKAAEAKAEKERLFAEMMAKKEGQAAVDDDEEARKKKQARLDRIKKQQERAAKKAAKAGDGGGDE